jgi:glycine hydroxymethyltransferase
MCREQFQKELDRAVFPTVQGGPLMHVVAAKAVCFKEAMAPTFKDYQQQVIANAKMLAQELSNGGFRIVSGGTDNHLMLVDVLVRGLTGSQAEKALERAAITVNKNAIPFDTQPPMKASGIRIGTPALTTRGMKEPEMRLIAGLISEVLGDPENEAIQSSVRGRVKELCERFPIYENRLVRSRAQHNA